MATKAKLVCDSDISLVRDGAKILDDVLDSARKVWIYDILTKKLVNKVCKKGLGAEDAKEIGSKRYARLMSKAVGEVFPKGVPETDAQWTEFLKADIGWAVKGYYRELQRHRMESLDAPIKSADDDEGITLSDMLASDGACSFAVNKSKPAFFTTPEARMELPLIHATFKELTRGNAREKRKILKELFLEGRDVNDVCDRYNIKRGTLYVSRLRFNEAMKTHGKRILERLEREIFGRAA